MSLTASAIIAEIEFIPPEAGGRRTTPPNPAGGHLMVKEDSLVTCTICALDGETLREDLDRFEFGQFYRVMIVPLVPDSQRRALGDLTLVQIFEGGRLVAHGTAIHSVEIQEPTVRAIRRLRR